MYNLLSAILEAQSKNGEDGKELVDGSIEAIRQFVIVAFGDDARVPNELERLAKLLVNGQPE